MRCQDHTAEVMELSRELLRIADSQREECDHDGCLLLDGVVRDCGWQLRNAALHWQNQLDILHDVM